MCNPLEELEKTLDSTWTSIRDTAAGVVAKATKTVENILKNPMPVITMAAATWVLGPSGLALVSASVAPVLAAGAISASQGGNIGQIAKSSLLAWGGGNFASATGVGDITKYVGSQIGGVTGSMTAAGLNNAFFNSTIAAVGGKDVGQAFGAGFVGGAAGAAAGAAMTSEMGKSFFGDIKDSFGLSDTQMKYIQGATLETSKAALSGQDPTTALSNYIAQNISNYGKKEFTEFLDSAKKSYQSLSSSGETLQSSQDNYDAVKTEYNNKLSEAENLRQSIIQDNAKLESLRNVPEYISYEKQYITSYYRLKDNVKYYGMTKDEYTRALDRYNNAVANKDEVGTQQAATDVDKVATKLQAEANSYEWQNNQLKSLYNDYTKPFVDAVENKKAEIEKKVSDFQKIKSDIETPNQDGTNLAAKFLAASNDLQSKYDQFTTSKQNVDDISKQYITKLADIGSNEGAAQAEAARQEEARQEALAEEARQQAAALEAQRQAEAEAARQAEEARAAAQAEADRQAELARTQRDEEERAKAEELRRMAQEEADKQAAALEAQKQAEAARQAEEEKRKAEEPPPTKEPETPTEETPTTETPLEEPKTEPVTIPGDDGGTATVDPKTGEVTFQDPTEEPWTPPTDLPPADTPTGIDNEGGDLSGGDAFFWDEFYRNIGINPASMKDEPPMSQADIDAIIRGENVPVHTSTGTVNIFKGKVVPTTPAPTTPTTQPTTQPVTQPTNQPTTQPTQQNNPLGMLALLDILGQPQQQQAPQPVEGAKIELMDDIFGTNFFTPRPEPIKKYSSGGEIEALLHLLRS